MIGLDQWPEIVLPLAVRFGPEKTYTAGMDHLGYPVWMVTEIEEVLQLNNFLKREIP